MENASSMVNFTPDPAPESLPPSSVIQVLRVIAKITERIWQALTKGESLPEGLTPKLLREIEKELQETLAEFRDVAIGKIRTETRERIGEATNIFLKVWEFLKGCMNEAKTKGIMLDMEMKAGIMRNIQTRHGLPESTYGWLLEKHFSSSLQNLA